MSSPESCAQHVARRLELITNWLALLALLGIGVVWVPADDHGVGAPASSGAALYARASVRPPLPAVSAPLRQAQSQPAHAPCRL
jgi:hypothetical protein